MRLDGPKVLFPVHALASRLEEDPDSIMKGTLEWCHFRGIFVLRVNQTVVSRGRGHRLFGIQAIVMRKSSRLRRVCSSTRGRNDA